MVVAVSRADHATFQEALFIYFPSICANKTIINNWNARLKTVDQEEGRQAGMFDVPSGGQPGDGWMDA